MKRLFGLIGFTFLFVLSAVFYSDFNEIVFAIIGSLGLLSVAVGFSIRISVDFADNRRCIQQNFPDSHTCFSVM